MEEKEIKAQKAAESPPSFKKMKKKPLPYRAETENHCVYLHAIYNQTI